MSADTSGRIVVAMSGGVDSSVTAALLKEQGHDIVGITLQLYDQGAATGRKGACCAGQDIHDAARVAETIGIPHYVLDYETRFRDAVIEDFADSYFRGETPIPCINCNEKVKFRDLLAVARDLGASALATGHYARRIDGPAGAELHCARDGERDQTYFLSRTTSIELDFLRFPLGDLTKNETRALARRYELPVAAKPDSQDICFVPNGSYADLLRRLRPGTIEPGDIVNTDGKILGRHDGIIDFTVGQRRGLGVAGTEPLYVLRLEPATRQVVVGPRAALAQIRVALNAINWLGSTPPPVGLPIAVKLRSAQPPIAARLFLDGVADHVVLEQPAFGVAPGQACVFYDGPRCLGGGWIARTDNLEAAPA